MESNREEIYGRLYEMGQILDDIFLWTVLNFVLGVLIFPVIVLLVKWIKLLKCLWQLSQIADNRYLEKTVKFYVASLAISFIGNMIVLILIFQEAYVYVIENELYLTPSPDVDLITDEISGIMDKYMVTTFVLGVISGLVGFYALWFLGEFAQSSSGYFEIALNHQNFVNGIKYLKYGAITETLVSIITVITFIYADLDLSGIFSIVTLLLQLMGYKVTAAALNDEFNPNADNGRQEPDSETMDASTDDLDQVIEDPYESTFEIDPSFCPRCGREVAENERFCVVCGSKLRL